MAEFAERAKLGRPEVDESSCFVCQEEPPTVEAIRGKEKFALCAGCAAAVEERNRRDNKIKQALARGRGGDIFRMTLGVDLLPTRIDMVPRKVSG